MASHARTVNTTRDHSLTPCPRPHPSPTLSAASARRRGPRLRARATLPRASKRQTACVCMQSARVRAREYRVRVCVCACARVHVRTVAAGRVRTQRGLRFEIGFDDIENIEIQRFLSEAASRWMGKLSASNKQTTLSAPSLTRRERKVTVSAGQAINCTTSARKLARLPLK